MSMMTARESDREHDANTAAAKEPNQAASPKVSHRAASYDRGVQIAAAQLRLVTDRRLGQTTPDWIKQLAQEEPQAS
jgi:hypothetical protein